MTFIPLEAVSGVSISFWHIAYQDKEEEDFREQIPCKKQLGVLQGMHLKSIKILQTKQT